MEQLKVTEFDLIHMCRLCLSGVSKADIFLFSSGLGKKIADIVMECVPVHITKQDKMPTYICQLCFTQLKKFHQFQMQALQSDQTLKRYLQQLSDSHPQIKVEMALEELSDHIVNENYNADVTVKSEPVEISDEFDIFYTKQKLLTNFNAVNIISPEISLESEIKDEPMNDNSLIEAECADTLKSLSKIDGGEISCEGSMIEFGDTKVGVDMPSNVEWSSTIENDTTEKIFVKSEEKYVPLKEADSSVCPENIKDAECLRSNENDLNRTEHPSKLEKPYRCEICKKFFSELSNFKKHSFIHTGEKPYKCDICQMCFRQVNHLKNHKLKHTGETPYQCDVCKMCFRHAYSFKCHKLKHTGEKPYQCDMCQMSFRQLTHLKNHKFKHTGEKPYQCDICKTCFSNAHILKSHKSKHTGEKPYQCDICKMCFRQLGNLKRHNLVHTGEKPHQCEICKKCFRQAHSLKSHKSKHTGEKPYQCDICKMCFGQLSNLKRHNLVHTGEKPYQCKICKQCFSQWHCLKKHNLIHSGEKQ